MDTEVEYQVTRDFTFTAKHHVEFDTDHHQCTTEHEHRFVVRVELAIRQLDDRGMVLDFRSSLDPFAAVLVDRYDRRDLNDLLEQPTSEHIARTLIDELHDAVPASKAMRCAVGVSEDSDVWAWCRHA